MTPYPEWRVRTWRQLSWSQISADWISAISSVVVATGVGVAAWHVYLASKQVKVMSEQAQATGEQVKVMSEQTQATGEQVKVMSEQTQAMVEQVKVMSEQIEKDQERSRRENAINLIKDWALFTAAYGADAKSIAEKLSSFIFPEDVQNLWDRKSIAIPTEQQTLVRKFFDSVNDPITNQKQFDDKKQKIKLTESQVSKLRSEVIKYLNMLEVILSARRHHVADGDMIKEQFLSLVVPTENKYILPCLRNIAGGVNAYPSIEEFVQERKSELTSPPESKKRYSEKCLLGRCESRHSPLKS